MPTRPPAAPPDDDDPGKGEYPMFEDYGPFDPHQKYGRAETCSADSMLHEVVFDAGGKTIDISHPAGGRTGTGSSPPRLRRKHILLLIVVAILAGGAAYWYFVDHLSAEEQALVGRWCRHLSAEELRRMHRVKRELPDFEIPADVIEVIEFTTDRAYRYAWFDPATGRNVASGTPGRWQAAEDVITVRYADRPRWWAGFVPGKWIDEGTTATARFASETAGLDRLRLRYIGNPQDHAGPADRCFERMAGDHLVFPPNTTARIRFR